MKKLLSLILSLFMTSAVFAQTDPTAKINLTMVGPAQSIPSTVGHTFVVQLMMNAATTNQRYLVSDIVFGWNPKHIELIGVNHEGSHPMIWDSVSGLPTGQGGDYYGLNEVMPPADGNGLYFGYAELGQHLLVTNEQVKIVNFIFRVVGRFDTTEVSLIPELTIDYPAKTVVYGSYIGGMKVTGTLTNATIDAFIPGDFDNDGVVGSNDMTNLLGNWGVSTFTDNPYDLDGNGVVGAGDLAILVSNWS
jgi:hypothetical protein